MCAVKNSIRARIYNIHFIVYKTFRQKDDDVKYTFILWRKCLLKKKKLCWKMNILYFAENECWKIWQRFCWKIHILYFLEHVCWKIWQRWCWEIYIFYFAENGCWKIWQRWCWKIYISYLYMYIKKCGIDYVGKYTFSIWQKMYADPPVIEHFGMETKQGGETLSFNVWSESQ